jgi:hypothetical protein
MNNPISSVTAPRISPPPATLLFAIVGAVLAAGTPSQPARAQENPCRFERLDGINTWIAQLQESALVNGNVNDTAVWWDIAVHNELRIYRCIEGQPGSCRPLPSNPGSRPPAYRGNENLQVDLDSARTDTFEIPSHRCRFPTTAVRAGEPFLVEVETHFTRNSGEAGAARFSRLRQMIEQTITGSLPGGSEDREQLDVQVYLTSENSGPGGTRTHCEVYFGIGAVRRKGCVRLTHSEQAVEWEIRIHNSLKSKEPAFHGRLGEFFAPHLDNDRTFDDVFRLGIEAFNLATNLDLIEPEFQRLWSERRESDAKGDFFLGIPGLDQFPPDHRPDAYLRSYELVSFWQCDSEGAEPSAALRDLLEALNGSGDGILVPNCPQG